MAARLSREKVFEQLKEADKNAPFALLERAEALLAFVKQGALGELEMLQIAVELEKKFRKIHVNYTLIFADPGLKKTFDALARGDEKHLAKLKERINMFKPSGQSS